MMAEKTSSMFDMPTAPLSTAPLSTAPPSIANAQLFLPSTESQLKNEDFNKSIKDLRENKVDEVIIKAIESYSNKNKSELVLVLFAAIKAANQLRKQIPSQQSSAILPPVQGGGTFRHRYNRNRTLRR